MTDSTPEQPRRLTVVELDALRDAMKGTIHPLPAAHDHMPNALTAETLQKSDAGVDVYQASSEGDLFDQLGIQKE